jgi:hypothetical protein
MLAFSFDGKYSENAIYLYLLDLRIIQKEEEVRKKHASSSTTTSGFTPTKLELSDDPHCLRE